jgi:hypothetical protein
MSKPIGWLALLPMGLAACAGAGSGGLSASEAVPYPPAVYQHRVSTNDVEIYWNCAQPEAGTAHMEGVVRNSKGGVVGFMELELAAADAQGKYVASVKRALEPIMLRANQLAPFSLQVGAGGGAERFDLYYGYDRDATLGEAQQAHFLARDVCSATQHLVRQQR